MTIRIAMWSGPRNISTAMMRAWENRPDCAVIDEPFYACYLAETGLPHPCREAVLAAQSHQRAGVTASLTTDTPAAVFYQKHMTHHMPSGSTLDWSRDFRHAFLIRDPAAVVASYLKKMPSVTADDIGIERQFELFQTVTALQGCPPPVIDSADVLRDPRRLMGLLCDALDVPRRDVEMTRWRAGPRPSDGVWADHWYGAVRESTGFAPPDTTAPALVGASLALANAMRPFYEAMAAHCIG